MRQASLKEHERLDDLMKSGRHIIQNTQEFCFSLDAVLLAHFPRVHKNDRVLELGTGTGVIPLLIADEAARIDAVELSPVMADVAARNVIMNELEDKIFVREGDYRAIEQLYPRESFDLVLANPPYRPVTQGMANKIAGVARARHEFTATLADVVRAAQVMLRFGGHFAMVHLPERLGEIIVALHEHQMEGKRLRMVQPKAAKAPNMMLIEAVKGANPGGLQVLPPLIVHEADGVYTREIFDIYGMEDAL
ncbi:tRNA1(Val) (adenine(37)-N6)-methyltransferase [Selenomonas sp.]|uniref:tRNA1(Val) (adenine(37)-N6)-methyltransferase n=2 Tax=Selenomonas sp. TaxID=2053611 RepID=UPI002A74E5B7|nr:methyltransferase [Selenomonas sp.]MDY3298696.1 methyltransferase [Selenomonas sp.]